jgi:hypothetical protein
VDIYALTAAPDFQHFRAVRRKRPHTQTSLYIRRQQFAQPSLVLVAASAPIFADPKRDHGN